MRLWVRIHSAPMVDRGDNFGRDCRADRLNLQPRNAEELRQARERAEATINVAEMGFGLGTWMARPFRMTTWAHWSG